MNALAGPHYDLTRLGFEIVASPRHADAITVTGPMTPAMRPAAAATSAATPAPKIVLAIGDCAIGTGPLCNVGSAGEGAGRELGASVDVAGCPPTPADIVRGLVRAARLLDERQR